MLKLFIELLEGRNVPSPILVNNPLEDVTAQDTQSETSVILNSQGQLVVAFNDSAAYSASNPHFTGWAYSADGGATFTDPGALPSSPQGDLGDPVLAMDTTNGFVYLSTLNFGS